jgi:hypothetical protein
MLLGFLRSLAHHENVQPPTDDASDISERHALVRNPVIPDSRGTFLEHEPVKMRSVKPVYGGPTVGPVTHIGRGGLLTRLGDENRNETMIAVAMHRWRKRTANTRTPSAATYSAASSDLRGKVESVHVLFC